MRKTSLTKCAKAMGRKSARSRKRKKVRVKAKRK